MKRKERRRPLELIARLGALARKQRCALGWTQVDLRDATGGTVDTAIISRFERGGDLTLSAALPLFTALGGGLFDAAKEWGFDLPAGETGERVRERVHQGTPKLVDPAREMLL